MAMLSLSIHSLFMYALGSYIFWCIVSFLRNWSLARRIGLPYSCFVISEFNIANFFFHTSPLVKWFLRSSIIPKAWKDHVRMSHAYSRWQSGYDYHAKHGDCLLLCTPGSLSCQVADADAVNEIVSSRTRFPKPIWQYVNDFEKPKLIEDKISRGGQFSDSDISPGCTKTYRDALEYFNRNIFQILLTMKIFPRWMLDRAPRFIFQYAEGHDNLESYLRQLVESERSKPRVNADKGLQAKDDRANNILSLLVRQEELAKTQEDAAKGKLETTAPSASLSDAEILGNVYIFALAGHETTAITLIYALTMLALYPEKQAWLHASLDSILATQSSYPRVWTYEELYPQLTAPLCVMFETLRHFPPAPTIPKWTGGSSQTLTIAGRTYHLPPYFPISINVAALHMNPKYYGPDVNSWDPVRWDPTNKSSFLYDPKKSSNPLPVNSPPINKYPKGAFMPWSDGYRGCLGKKFSQVEFVTTITVLCSRWKIGIKNECGETQDDARERVLGILARSNINNVGSLGMKEPFDFTFEKRV